MIGLIPPRQGDRPVTTATNPHEQRSQNPSPEIYSELKARAFSFQCIDRVPSRISVPGAEALWMHDACCHGPAEAFLVGNEFAHIHPEYDGSLHLALPEKVANELIEKGWAEPHPVAKLGLIPSTIIMVYAPRNYEEVDWVVKIIEASYGFAHGTDGKL
ncbi:MAG: DUF5519 family protein [Gammaproteobacteria bacterium]|nr:DUF5519 family protein [Gammaproteobacteria bacterium]